MTINNLEFSVPQQARQLLYSCIPYGSEYVIFTSSYNQGQQVYTLIYKEPAKTDLHQFNLTHANNTWDLTEVNNNNVYDSFSVQVPYYAYSSVRGQGVKEALPISSEIGNFMLIVICCLLVLKTVFGGIKLWSQKRRYSVY